MDKFLTVAEVADGLRVQPDTVKRWIKTGVITASRVGRKYVISQKEIERVLDNGKHLEALADEAQRTKTKAKRKR